MKPFPTAVNIIFHGHESPVISIDVSPTGDYLATGDDSGMIIICDVMTSRILYQKQFEDEPILSINWSSKNLLLFSHGQKVEIMVWKFPIIMKNLAEATLSML